VNPNQHAPADEGINPLASVISEMPEVWTRLLKRHVPDSRGRCADCRNASTAGVPWPCTLRVIAEDAQAISAGAALAVSAEAISAGAAQAVSAEAISAEAISAEAAQAVSAEAISRCPTAP